MLYEGATTHVGNEDLGHLYVVVEGGQVESSEPVILRLVDRRTEGEVGENIPYGPHVPPEGGMVEGVEPVVVGDGVVGLVLHQQVDDVVALLGDGVVKGCVTLRVLSGNGKGGVSWAHTYHHMCIHHACTTMCMAVLNQHYYHGEA